VLSRANERAENVDSLGPAGASGPDKINKRRAVRLDVTVEQPAATTVARTTCDQPAVGRDRWLRLAERAIGDWGHTLRTAFLVVTAFAGAVVLVGVAFGFSGALLGAILGAAVLYLLGRPTTSLSGPA